MSWFLVGGAAIGAGVSSYGHDNWGWNKDAIWQGALVGGAGGYAASGMAGGGVGTTGVGAKTATGAKTIGTFNTATPFAQQAAQGLMPANMAGGGGLMAGLTQPLIPGMAFTSPMMLGAAGLTLAGGMSSRGSSFQDPISLSPEGKKLQKEYFATAKKQMTKAKAGDVSEKAFQDISRLKTAEGIRQRATQGTINVVQARAANIPKEQRGVGVVGGAFVKGQLADVGERMTGLFAPTSTLNVYRKEGLMNAAKQIQNIRNIENQTASLNYASSLAKWGAGQALGAQKGATIGSVATMMGGAQLQQAYLNQIKIAS